MKKKKKSPPKPSIKTLQEAAFKYENLRKQSKSINSQIIILRSKIFKTLNFLKKNSIDIDKKAEKPLRIQKIIKKKLIYNENILREVIRKKNKKYLRTAFKVVIDELGIDELYNEGILTYDELIGCVDEIKESVSISILRVKANSREIKEFLPDILKDR